MEYSLNSYEDNKPYVFISCSSEDSKQVSEILGKLQNEGLNFWYEENEAIDKKTAHICNCEFVMAFHSANSKNSLQCKEEIFFARSPEVNKKIISVYLENVELSLGVMLSINRFPIINFYDSSERENFYSELLSQSKKFLPQNDEDQTKRNVVVVASAACAIGSAVGSTVTLKSSGSLLKMLPYIAGGFFAGGFFADKIRDFFSRDKKNSPSYKEENFQPYEGNKPYAFISYSHKDSERVFEILGKLQDKGLRFWYDKGIKKGSDWSDNIAEHIRDCECMLAFHSENSNTSEHCKDEICFAKWREINKKIFSVYLEKVELSLGVQMAIIRFQNLNFYEYLKDEKKFFDELSESPLLQSCFQ